MANNTLGSILLGTTDPDALRAWYIERFAPDHDGNGPIDLGGVGLVIDGRDDVADKSAEPARFILNFHVDDAQAEAARLSGIGVTWLVEMEKREGGWFGTLVDPDGNYVQVIQLNH